MCANKLLRDHRVRAAVEQITIIRGNSQQHGGCLTSTTLKVNAAPRDITHGTMIRVPEIGLKT